jgi:hypothetical protein
LTNVRVQVARNPNTSPETLELLVRDEESTVRLALLENPNLPGILLGQLVYDRSEPVRKLAQLRIKQPYLSPTQSKFEQASNAFTPLEELSRLRGDSSPRVRRAVMRNHMTPRDVLRRFDLAERSDPTLEPEELEQLARGSKYARFLAARHPSTRAETLIRLAEHGYGEAVAQNPGAPQSLLSALADQAAGTYCVLIAMNPQAPLALLKKFAQSEDPEVREALARNPALTPKLMDALSRDPDWSVREALAVWARVGPNLIAQLAQDEWSVVREAAARHPYIAAGVLSALASDSDEDVRLAVAENANTFPATLEALLDNSRKDVRMRVALAAHPNAPQELLDRLLLDSNAWVSRLVRLREPDVSAQILEAAALHRRVAMRLVTSLHPTTPLKALEHLVNDADARVRAFVAGHPNTPPAVLEQLKLDVRWDVREIANAVSHASKPFREMNLTCPDARVRRAVAAHPNAAPDRLDALVKDYNRAVLLALATNPRTPTEVLKRLAEDEYLRRFVILNPTAHQSELVQAVIENHDVRDASKSQITEAAFRRYGRSIKVSVRRKVASHQDAPVELLHELVGDPSPEVRIELIGNPRAPDSIRERLARDPDLNVRIAVAEHKLSSAHVLEILAQDSDTQILELVAGRRNASSAVLERLSRYPSAAVRSVLVRNPATPAAALDWLAHVVDQKTQVRIAKHPNVSENTLNWLSTDYITITLVFLMKAIYFRRINHLLMKMLKHRISVNLPLLKAISASKVVNKATITRLASLPEPEIHKILLDNPSISEHLKAILRFS